MNSTEETGGGGAPSVSNSCALGLGAIPFRLAFPKLRLITQMPTRCQ